MAEDLTEYLLEHGFRVRYLHSEVDTLERIQIIRELRLGEYDALVGVNLLREGLDLPEVSLVAILDADKEGFLRGETSLIQTIGRAARNVRGRVLMYADKETDAMRKAISETDRRRAIQVAYNEEHDRFTAETVKKGISDMAEFLRWSRTRPNAGASAATRPRPRHRRSSRSWWSSWRRRCWSPPRICASRKPLESATSSRSCARTWTRSGPKPRGSAPPGPGGGPPGSTEVELGEDARRGSTARSVTIELAAMALFERPSAISPRTSRREAAPRAGRPHARGRACSRRPRGPARAAGRDAADGLGERLDVGDPVLEQVADAGRVVGQQLARVGLLDVLG